MAETPIVEQVAAILARGRMANQPDKNAREVVALVRADWGERIAQQIEADFVREGVFDGIVSAVARQCARIAREVER